MPSGDICTPERGRPIPQSSNSPPNRLSQYHFSAFPNMLATSNQIESYITKKNKGKKANSIQTIFALIFKVPK